VLCGEHDPQQPQTRIVERPQSRGEDLKPIYTAIEDAAASALKSFDQAWAAKYPMIGESWRAHWELFIPFLAFPEVIRRIVCTTNSIEAVNRQLRKIKIPQSPGRRGRATGDSRQIARSRYALWKSPDDLNRRQRHQLDWIAKTDPRLWRAYLLKEGLRYVFAVKGAEGKEALDKWLTWARRSQLPSLIHLAKRITKHREAIEANLEHGLSQGLIESTSTKIRLLTRIAFGFHGPQPLIALAMLALGSHPPRLPGRT
jgi:hypothetical protein